MAEKGKRYRVIEDDENFFKTGDIVIALENSPIPYCILEQYYEKGKTKKDYDPYKINYLDDCEIEEIESEEKVVRNEADVVDITKTITISIERFTELILKESKYDELTRCKESEE